ncbi:LysM peptidoglycan-binding domain-containing protein [Halobacillus sp. GSS1]|uniref:LysM peptidoglycan-binding domain-containing protein n=1 Tax=Halobacillus sp. GSS1 TaxID=2815919 RepID=UPI001A8EE728|nr:LysM peptidoglycan-binding domain-containing protein [Halobacillus sp. GSS1]MBN9654040.1 LysM peptidoglycan-binding domain-containing protein [Halobacillus sp. GSS1]
MIIHAVENGDSLWKIAQRYGADLNQIILLNQLNTPDIVVIGQALVIPEPEKEYVVQPGDNLWNIASRYGVRVQDLAEKNNMANPALIFVGQMLLIPFTNYTVQPGDSLWKIANQFGVSVSEIAEANGIQNPSVISVGMRLAIPSPLRPVKEINAYITRINAEGASEVNTLGSHFTYLSPFTRTIQADGNLTDLDDAAVLQAAAAQNISPLLVVTNFIGGSFDSDLAATFLRNPGIQDSFINNLLAQMRSKGYSGVNFDFEYVYPEDKENYNAFLRKVVSRLRPEGFSVSTALAPKVREDQQGLLYEAHDYEAHGDIVDFVVLMTYEWGWSGGRPWAIAPINKVREVLDYAVTVIPRDKILMGMPLYGREWEIPWVQGTYARTVNPQEAIQLAARYGVPIQYNEEYKSPFFRYTDENGQQHEVWFEDARSVQAKYDTVEEYGLRGASYWVLGSPFPQNWPVLQRHFKVKKT